MPTSRKRGRPRKYASMEEREAMDSTLLGLLQLLPPPTYRTGTGEPSVTYELEELLPPVSLVPAPVEVEESYIQIDELSLGLNISEAAARPEPEISIQQSLPTRSERLSIYNLSNLDTRV
ncbi:hypothetical protein BDV59DRAFT_206681 [Aspergillus ambiguus]|uniref:uncharacterized protein n=1 Tax=Aspergillus ambiguus TaxID=176160 RepID=UPI003CCE4FA4